MKDKIFLNKETAIDLPKLIESRLLVQANSGGGKSWLLRRILEQSHGKVQQIIIDPEGEFSTLREKYDYIYVGKDGDLEASTKSATLLARKLLEFNTSAIIDLYELHPQERKHFVKLFLDSMINSPKELHHPVLVVIDEAHMFAPEKGESEALNAVIGLASLGRKRQFCAILATQRISKLNKDVVAECNNKLIGRTGLDIDMKRAGEELGFTTKEKQISLRNLDAGEFYMFGPAISKEVITGKIGEIFTHAPKIGNKAGLTVPKPTDKIKGILAKLGDLPAEAQKEAQTVQELKIENTNLKRENTNLKKNNIVTTAPAKPITLDTRTIEKTLKEFVKKYREQWNPLEKLFRSAQAHSENLKMIQNQIVDMAEQKIHPLFIVDSSDRVAETTRKYFDGNLKRQFPSIDLSIGIRQKSKDIFSPITYPTSGAFVNREGLPVEHLPAGEKKVLIAIAQHPEGINRQHLTIITGYKRSSRDLYLQRLNQKGYIDNSSDEIKATREAIDFLGGDFTPLPTGEKLREHLLSTLPQGEKNILVVLIEAFENGGGLNRDRISELTGYQRSSRDLYIQRLTARQLVLPLSHGMVQASSKLFE